MTPLEREQFRNRMLSSRLRHYQHHTAALERACSSVCAERDNLAAQVQEMERTLIEIWNTCDNDIAVMGQTIQDLQGNLRTSLDEQIRLLAQRRILAKHLQAMMHLARPQQESHKAETILVERPQVLFVHEAPRPSLRARLASWIRMPFAPTAA